MLPDKYYFEIIPFAITFVDISLINFFKTDEGLCFFLKLEHATLLIKNDYKKSMELKLKSQSFMRKKQL
jgi:hypothetical protein